MSAWRAVPGVLFAMALVSAGCQRPVQPVFECSNGNYRDNPSGSGTCVCADHRWQCGEGSGADAPNEASARPAAQAAEGRVSEGGP
jgi:hypothetical protein